MSEVEIEREESTPRSFTDIKTLMNSDSEYDTDLEDLTNVEPENDICRDCKSSSAKRYRQVTKSTGVLYQHRIAQGIHDSHAEETNTELSIAFRHLQLLNTLPFLSSLQCKPQIRKLDLSYNSLGERGGIGVCLALINNPFITELILDGNEFGSTNVAAYLSILLVENNNLSTLSLAKNKLNDHDCFLLSYGIMENNYITDLDLSGNRIEQEGAGFIGQALAVNNTLDRINLAENVVRKQGSVLICKGISANHMLTEVDLSFSGIGYDGALAVRELLGKNSILMSLNISQNHLNWEGALIISDGIEKNTTLKRLVMGDNPLTTTGCMDIIDAVSANCTLQFLGLQNVNVVREFRQVVQMITEKKPEFQTVYGEVVRNHDVLGLRPPRQLHPMNKVLQYLLEKELRPVELLRIMDKSVSFKLTMEQFFNRAQMLGINILKYEQAEMTAYILKDQSLKSSKEISYTIMVDCIERYVEQERDYRIKQRQKLRKLTQYQTKLLNKALVCVNSQPAINAITHGLLEQFQDNDAIKEEIAERKLNILVHNARIEKLLITTCKRCCRKFVAW